MLNEKPGMEQTPVNGHDYTHLSSYSRMSGCTNDESD